MSKKTIKNLVLLIVCAGLGMYLALTGRGHSRRYQTDDTGSAASPQGNSAPATPPAP